MTDTTDPERKLADARAAFWTTLDGLTVNLDAIHSALDAVEAAARAYRSGTDYGYICARLSEIVKTDLEAPGAEDALCIEVDTAIVRSMMLDAIRDYLISVDENRGQTTITVLDVVKRVVAERDRLLTTLRTIPGYPDTPLHPGPWWPEAALNSAEAEAAKWRDERNAFLNAMVKAQSALTRYGKHDDNCDKHHWRDEDGYRVHRCTCGLEAAMKGADDGE